MLLANEVGVCWVSRKENAMAIVLEPKSSYNLISRAESSNNKLLMHVKLTDSCLRALEDYQLAEVSPRRKPSIKFSGYQGSILIPLGKADSGDENTAEFQLDCSAILSAGQQGGMDCIQQSGGSSDIRTLGAVTHKITVRATDDSYQMTQQRMKEAEEERKGISTKVINTPKKGSRKVFKGYKQTNNVMAAMKRQIKSGPGAKVSSGPSKTLRERVIHLLAVRPYKKPELISRLTKEGVNLKDRNSLTGILQQVAVMTDNQYRLLKHLYSEVQVETWPSYSETEKQILRRKIKTELNNSSVVTSSSPPKTKNSETSKPQSKRHRQSEAEHSAKKQRISHIKNNNNIVKDSLEKDTFQVEKAKLPEEKERERVEESVLDKKDENDDEEESISAENSLNGLNGLDSSDFTKKYKPITTYEQRCLYKKDFNAELPEYESLKAKVDSMKKKIHDLQSKRLQFPEGTAEREDLDKEIREHYHEMIKDPRWLPTTNRCQELHKKLSYIKRLIADYDKGAANT